MVPIRTYWNSVEAMLERSLLENYDVSCALLYENANLYGRAPLAMPIRLVVEDDQADWARYILTGDFEAAANLDRIAIGVHPENSESPLPAVKRGSPWELLIIAFYFFLPAICFLQTKYPIEVSYSRRVQREIAAVTVAHFLGWIAIIFASFLVALFWRISRSSALIEKLPSKSH